MSIHIIVAVDLRITDGTWAAELQKMVDKGIEVVGAPVPSVPAETKSVSPVQMTRQERGWGGERDSLITEFGPRLCACRHRTPVVGSRAGEQPNRSGDAQAQDWMRRVVLCLNLEL